MLVDEIKERRQKAMKDRNRVDRELLGVVLGEVQTIAARGGREPTDEDATAVVRRLLKSNQETLAVSEDVEQQRALEQEIAMLRSFLPRTLGVEQILVKLSVLAEEVKAAKNDGQAIGIAMKHLKAEGAAVDGKDVAQAVQQLRAG